DEGQGGTGLAAAHYVHRACGDDGGCRHRRGRVWRTLPCRAVVRRPGGHSGLMMVGRIFVAGHTGMVGSALVRALSGGGRSVITRTRAELDLTDSNAVEIFFAEERPAVVFLAAAKVGG